MRPDKRLVISVLACSVSVGASVRASTVSLTPIKDNSIFDVQPETSNGQGDLFCGMNGSGVVQRFLLAFDVAGSVPAGSTVTSASLTMMLVRGSRQSDLEEHHGHRLENDWGEGASMALGGGGAEPTAGDTTWSFRFYNDQDRMWDTPGGDFLEAESATEIVGAESGSVTWQDARMVADVQEWLDNPDSNFGWIVLGNETSVNTARRFRSREAADMADRPTLTIEFDGPADGSDGGTIPICGLGVVGSMLPCMILILGFRIAQRQPTAGREPLGLPRPSGRLTIVHRR